MSLKTGPQLYYLPLSSIVGADYNPKGRDNPNSKDIRDLAESIETVGQLNPVNVTKQGNKYLLADGHRRLAALKLLQKEEVLAHINGPDTAKVYQHINHHQKAHTPNQKLQAFLSNPDTVPSNLQNAFKKMTKQIGKRLVNKLAKSGYGYGTYRQAGQVAEYTGLDTGFVLQYIMDTKQTYVLRSAIELGWKPEVLKNKIVNNELIAI